MGVDRGESRDGGVGGEIESRVREGGRVYLVGWEKGDPEGSPFQRSCRTGLGRHVIGREKEERIPPIIGHRWICVKPCLLVLCLKLDRHAHDYLESLSTDGMKCSHQTGKVGCSWFDLAWPRAHELIICMMEIDSR